MPVILNYSVAYFIVSIFYYFKNLVHILEPKNIMDSQVVISHTCNPSYSGGRDKEDCSSNSDQGNSLWHPISSTPHK
jgi:hypothetical protein